MKIDPTKEYTYGIGTLAYYDAMFSGLIPIKIIDINSGINKVLVTKDFLGYKKGDILTIAHYYCIPRKHVYKSGCYLKIKTNFKWSRNINKENLQIPTPLFDQFVKDCKAVAQLFNQL